VNKSTRGYAQIVLYRGQTPTQIRESDDFFAKDHTKEIVNLYTPKRKKFALFTSSWSEFLNDREELITEGWLELDVKELVPWFDDELSKGYSEADLDSEFDDGKHDNEDIQKISKMFIDAYPGIPLKMATKPFLEGWLRREHFTLFHEIGTLLPQIYADIRYKLGDERYIALMKDDDDDDEEDDDEESHVSVVSQTTLKDLDFPEFVSKNVSLEVLKTSFKFEEGRKVNEKLVRTVLKIVLEYGPVWTQQQMADAANISKGTLNEILKTFRNINFRREIGYCLEDWWVSKHGGRSAHNESKPDWIDNENEDLINEIISFKWRLDYGAELKFYQSNDFGPEYTLARKIGKNYKVGLINSAWANKLVLKEVNPFCDPDVKFSKVEFAGS